MFFAPDQSKMISLQYCDDVPVDLFLPLVVALLFPRCWLQKLPLYFVVFKIVICFSKTQLAMQLPYEKTRVATQVECGISQWLT